MRAPDWYHDWRHDAVHQLMDKNERNKRDFNLDGWERYDYDVDAETLIFSHQGRSKVIARIQVVGTTAKSANNWLWAWANAHWPEKIIIASQDARAFGTEHGICELTHDYLEDDDLEELGWAMAAVTARITDAQGAYRPPDKNGSLFLVYYDMKFVS